MATHISYNHPTPHNEYFPWNMNNSVNIGDRNQANFDLYNTLLSWRHEVLSVASKQPKNILCPSNLGIEALQAATPKPVQRSELQGEEFDIQGINWKATRVSRSQAQHIRKCLYENFNKIRSPVSLRPCPIGPPLANCENFFRFRRMDFNHKIQIFHFQLRNLIATPTRDHIFYVGRSKVLHCTPTHGAVPAIASTVLDLTDPMNPSPYAEAENIQGVQITTMAVGNNILIAGGFFGEYGLVNLNAEKGTEPIQGLITEEPFGCVNHIQIHSTRSNASPVAAFASNNACLQVLNVHTNTVISERPYGYAINCSAVSTDKRLRVMVGDTREVLICNAESGELLQALEGHSDFGSTCDWADDGWTVATGSQDQQIKIWDARKWTTSQGVACPVAVIATQVAGGVRKLKFSPIGSGKRVLVAAEPIDYMSIIDAERFATQQKISLFGDISGFDFCNNGQYLLVANSDSTRGGIMEFERSNLTSYGCFELKSALHPKNSIARQSEFYDWMSDDEMLYHPKTRTTLESLERRCVSLGEEMGNF